MLLQRSTTFFGLKDVTSYCILLGARKGKATESAPPVYSHWQLWLQRCTINNTFECLNVTAHPNGLNQPSPHHYNEHKATTCGRIFCLHLSQGRDIGGYHAHIMAMPYLYTTSTNDIFVPFHLKYAIPRQAAISLIAHGYNFIEINLGKHHLTKLANNKATKNLNHPQCVVSSSSPHMDPIRSFKFTTNNGDSLLPTRSQA